MELKIKNKNKIENLKKDLKILRINNNLKELQDKIVNNIMPLIKQKIDSFLINKNSSLENIIKLDSKNILTILNQNISDKKKELIKSNQNEIKKNMEAINKNFDIINQNIGLINDKIKEEKYKDFIQKKDSYKDKNNGNKLSKTQYNIKISENIIENNNQNKIQNRINKNNDIYNKNQDQNNEQIKYNNEINNIQNNELNNSNNINRNEVPKVIIYHRQSYDKNKYHENVQNMNHYPGQIKGIFNINSKTEINYSKKITNNNANENNNNYNKRNREIIKTNNIKNEDTESLKNEIILTIENLAFNNLNNLDLTEEEKNTIKICYCKLKRIKI